MSVRGRMILVPLAAVVAGCGAPATSRPVEPVEPASASVAVSVAAPACVADGLGELHVRYAQPACGDDVEACAAACAADDAGACMSAAYALEAAGDAEAGTRDAYGRACRLGLAIGCTNLGAYLWLTPAGEPGDPACARRLFDAACAADERFACAMVGRMMAAEATTPAARAAARAYFDQLCTDAGGVACRMYAFHLEQGDLGEASAGEIAPLLQRACETGDQESCGHTTAAEIFR